MIPSLVLPARPLRRLLGLSLVAALWLLLAPHASAELLKSPITLGPTTVLNGTATVSGRISETAPARATVSPTAKAQRKTSVRVPKLRARSVRKR